MGSPTRITRFSDVCGTIDEIKRILREGALDTGGEEARDLLADVTFMLDRMDARAREYLVFAREIRALADRMGEIDPSPRPTSEPLETRVVAAIDSSARGVEEICTDLEAARDVANRLEQTLRRYRESAARLYEAHAGIRGERNWSGDEGGPDELAAHVHAWLPPSPHREIVLDWLSRGRVHVVESDPGQPPVAVFEDGGEMPLHTARWSEDIRNFVSKTGRRDPSPPELPGCRPRSAKD